jgi:hypothetical protein
VEQAQVQRRYPPGIEKGKPAKSNGMAKVTDGFVNGSVENVE